MLAAIDLKPFVVSGLALGAMYALSGVGIVVLYRATGVLNLAYGALGALCALVAWQLIEDGMSSSLAYVLAVIVTIVVTMAYGIIFGARLAGRDPLVKAGATLGLALALLGALGLLWDNSPRFLELATTNSGLELFGVHVNHTQVLSLVIAIGITVVVSLLLRYTRLGVSMRALASDRELSSLIGVRVRRVELQAWALSGFLAGVSGIYLAVLFRLEPSALTLLVIPALAAAIIGRLCSLWGALVGGLVVGVLEAITAPYPSISKYGSMVPFLVGILGLLVVHRRKVIVTTLSEPE